MFDQTSIHAAYLVPNKLMAILTLIINNFMFQLVVLSLSMSFFFFIIIKKIQYHHHKGIIATKSYPLPPGPKPWPVFGSIFEMLKHKSTHEWIHKIMNEMKTEISCIRLGSVHAIVVTSPELGCEFFKKQDLIFATRPQSVTANLISEGYLSVILTPYGDQFKKMKKILTSKMTVPSKYTFYKRKISEEADHAIYYALNQCSPTRPDGGRGGIVNVRSVARQYTINMMKRIVFNKRYFGKGAMNNGGPEIEDEEHVDALLTVIHYIHSFSISDLLPWMSFLDLDGHIKLVNKALKIVRKYHDPIIEDRVLMCANNKGLRKDDEEKNEDFLDVLLKLKDDNGRPMLTVEEIKALITDLMLASADNPSNVVEWALAEMINQPEILSKATQELDKVVGKSRLVEQPDLPNLNYIKSCIKESFRLHPISPFNVPHVSMKDTTVSGYFIPKGSQVLLSRLGIGRNPRVWNDEPMKFKPERHFEEKRINSSNEEVIHYVNVNVNDTELNLMAFSVGRRGCPASIMGSTMVTLLLARLVQGFSWTVPSGVEKIDLAESENSLHLGNPLLAFAKPRLATNLYPQS